MKLKKDEGGGYVAPKIGLHSGVITSYITVGSSDDKFNPGTLKKEVVIVITLPKQHDSKDDGSPPEMLTISKWCRASLNEKANLYKFVNSLMNIEEEFDANGEFDLSKILGLNCMVHITDHTSDSGQKSVVINSVTPLEEGAETFELPTTKFDFEDFKASEFDALSEKMQMRIKLTPEWSAINFPV